MEEKFNIIKKYNFWDEKKIELGFYRTDYTDKILAMVLAINWKI